MVPSKGMQGLSIQSSYLQAKKHVGTSSLFVQVSFFFHLRVLSLLGLSPRIRLWHLLTHFFRMCRYGLFSITDKSSSFVGPLVVGLIADTTGNIRYAFFFLVFMVWSAVPILLSINVEKGRKDAREYVYRGGR